MLCEQRRPLLSEIYPMIRPRGGDFLYSAAEVKVMAEDIDAMRELADGFVFGCLTDEGDLDVAQNSELLLAARGKPCTLHRAIDVCKDPLKAATEAADLGFSRILTSGHEGTAGAGIAMIEKLQAAVGSRLVIMPGSGVTAANVAHIVERTGVSEVHSSCSNECESTMAYRDEKCVHKWRQTDRNLVKDVLAALQPLEKRKIQL